MGLNYFQWRSLKTRVTLLTLTIFLISIWSLAFYTSQMLRKDMQSALGQQQFSTVSIMADGINSELDNMKKSLEKVSLKITPAILGNAAAMQVFLENRPILQSIFNGGIFVTRLDGIAIADYPPSTGRIGINYMDRDWLAEALKGKSAIGRPVIGKALNVPVFVMAVPIRDTKGKVIGALAGVTNLGTVNFLDKIEERNYGKTGEFLLIAPQHKLYVTGTVKNRIMKPMLAPGINPLFDRYVNGYEGSGIVVDSRGVEVLSSAKQIPVAKWILVVRMPTKEAFAPIRAMQQRMALATIFLTLLAGLLIWWILKRQLSPIFTTIKALAAMSELDHPLQPLPITRQDEIGELIVGFNHLLETLRQRESALKEREDKYWNLFNNAEVGIFRSRLDGSEILEVNRKFLDIIGMTTEEVLGTPSINLWADPKERDEMVKRLAADGRVTAFEYKMLNKRQGEIRDCLTSLRLYREQGILEGTIHDITERKRAEEIIQKNLRFQQLLIDTIPFPVFYKDTAGIYRGGNKALEKIWGRPLDDIIGKTVYDISPSDLAETYERADHALLNNPGVQRYETSIESSEGIRRNVIFNKATFTNDEGSVAGLIGVIVDITERKQAEEALRRSEDKFRLAFQTSPDAININRLEDGLYIDINQGFTELTGFTREDVIGRTSSQINIWYDLADRERLIKGLRDQGFYENLEAQFRRKDGSLTTALMSARVLKLGGIPHIISITRDISKYRRVEKEKRLLEEQLQRAEKMEALGTLAGGVAHDLNNVLGIIVGYSQMLLFDVEESSPLRPGLVNILDASQRAAAIVQDLLTLARRGVSVRQVLNLNKTIVDCQNSPEFENLSFYHPSVMIKTDLDPDLLNLSGSAVHLGKALFNLISNASEAMPKGGTLTIKTSNHYLDRPIRGYDEVREGEYVVLIVSDSGEGIPEADLEHIFEPFYTKKVMGRSGTGLGLAVVWGTVKDHQGYINVQSTVGKGSAFTLYFPVTSEEITTGEVTVPPSECLGKGETILVIDDVKGQRDLATMMLRKLNYNVTSVESGEAAAAYLKNHRVDLLVLDMIMDPGMDGLETYKKILEVHPNQKAIIVSGFSDSDRVHATQLLGAGAYVKKPYVRERLGLAVRRELDK